jgi:putative lipoprotein
MVLGMRSVGWSRAAFVLLLAASTASFGPSSVRAEDRWVAPDKGLHFGVSAGLAVGAWGASVPLFDRPWPRFVVGAAVAVGAGAAKELIDLAGAGDPSGRDFVWDLAGAATGLLLSWVFDALLVSEGLDDHGRAPAAGTLLTSQRPLFRWPPP